MKMFFQSLTVALLTATVGAETLSWTECRRSAQENNLELSISRLKLKEAEAENRSQRSVFYPELDASVSRSTGERDSEQTDSLSGSVNASYTLFSGFGNRARVTQSEAELHAEQANYDQTCSNLEYNLRTAFAEQLYVQELIALVKKIAIRRANNVKLVEIRYEGGREHKGSLLLSRAQYSEAQFEVEQAKRDLELARRKLAKELGRIRFDAFEIKGELSADAPPENVRLYEMAMQTPGYRSAEAVLRAAEAGLTITRSDRFPKVSASGSVASSGETTFETESWQAGISVSLPLFAGGRLSQDIIASGLRHEQSKLDQENTLFTLLVNLQDALNSYHNADEQVLVQKEFMTATELRAEIARVQYKQGLLSFEDWDRIENDLITRAKSWIASRRNALTAEAAWKNTLGYSSIH